MKNLKISKSVFALTTVAAFLATGNLVYAQEEQEEQQPRSALLEEIVVVGTKKIGGETQQDAEIAITAFGADQLDALQVRSVSDLSFKIPNVQLDEIGTTKGTANFSVRGLGVNSSIPSIDPAVGVFIDGVYLGTNSGVVFDTFDLGSVETLRGPQGVLFGRNVTGGAVLINTGDPTDELFIKAKLAVDSGFRGTGENYTGSFVISGPLSEAFKGKLAVYRNDDQGWHENLFNGNDFGESETTLYRGALEYDVEGFRLLGKVEFGDSDGDGPAGQSSVNGSGAAPFAGPGFDRDSFDFAINTEGFQDSEWTNLSLRTEIDVAFGDGTITGIVGYRDYEQEGFSDIDATFAQVFDAAFNVDQDQFSTEVRYNGSFLSDRLDVTAGIFYFQQDLVYEEQRRVGGAQAAFDGGGILDHETIGVFASAEYAINERFTVNAGLRYTDETKEADIAQIELGPDGANDPCFLFSGGEGDRTCTLVPFDDFETDNVSAKIGFGYAVTDNFRIYSSLSRGFRAGGFNLRNTIGPDLDPDQFGAGPFEDEQIDTFELGFKSEPVPGARLNAALFYSSINDLQREVNVSGGTAVVLQVINNAADAEIYGLEVDTVWPVTNNLILSASLGLIEGNLRNVGLNIAAADGSELLVETPSSAENLDIPRLSPFTANLGLTYLLDTKQGQYDFNVNYAHRDQTPFTDNNLGFINAQDRVDASIGFTYKDTGLNFTLYGKNLSNEVLFGGDTQLSAGTFSPLSKGRVVGFEVNYEY